MGTYLVEWLQYEFDECSLTPTLIGRFSKPPTSLIEVVVSPSNQIIINFKYTVS